MKVIKNCILLGLVFNTFLISSCLSTKSEPAEIIPAEEVVLETEDEVLAVEEVIEIPEPTAEELFIEALENINLKVTEAPSKFINFGKTFTTPFTVQVTDNDGNPVSDFDLTVTYPNGKKNKQIVYTTLDVKTDSEGKVSFTPENTKFSVNASVTFAPKAITVNSEENPEAFTAVKTAVDKKIVEAPIQIRSDVISKGALLFIWDFNERNKPMNNSYEVLAQFRNRGMTMVGNAPTSDESYIGKSLNYLYKENYEIVQDAYGYLICGTIKFTKPVAQCEDSTDYLCSLVAQISAVNMKTGEEVFDQEFAYEAKGANWNKATAACKDGLSKLIVDALVYGL